MAKVALDIGGFSIIRRIGIGARSTIYLAVDEQNKTEVALKRVVFERPEDSRIFEQVDTEYKVARRIDHPYVRKCYKLKKIRSMFMVKEMLLSMEFFDGKSLEDSPALSLLDVMLVFRMVASGLHAMHQQGFVHCDIKPNNILMNESGTIKIIDLGQSCKIGTVKPRIQGTPDYIAPEQVLRKSLGPKTDVFNLGATMYWALTGKNVPTLIPKKNDIGLPIPPPPRLAPHELKKQLPIEVSKLVMDCIEDEPSKRPRDMMTVISRLDLLVHSILAGQIKTNKNASDNN
ncbi:MAG: serine/threonine-protein kinase [Phycisphaerae bacterium]|nr:serine/threonine-protein kinase [Phycisphaerae bacterium]MDD5381016.1 serine/threonine-protein kinase [Phycisphaerae bacterium]